MNKQRFNSQWSPKETPGEFNFGPSMTEPDTTMSIPEIIQRFVRGLPVDARVFPNESGRVADEEDFDFLDHNPAEFAPQKQKTAESSSKESESPKSAEKADKIDNAGDAPQ